MNDRRTKKERAEAERAWLAERAAEIAARVAATAEGSPERATAEADATENQTLLDKIDAKLDDYALHPKKGL